MTAEEDTDENGAAASDDDGSSYEGCDGYFAADEGPGMAIARTAAEVSECPTLRKGRVMGLESPKMASMVASGVVAFWRDCVSNDMDGRSAAAMESPAASLAAMERCSGDWSWMHLYRIHLFSYPGRCRKDTEEEKMAEIAMYDAKIAACEAEIEIYNMKKAALKKPA
ncbi:hypothetical protein VIGAN_09229100 [Vigna angularis var. angularis]|uniref:Uncharacterized protein n=1 Tax=Vigna angularis var. angularis TaxID=157739 RepID=A0A0S3T0C3_PHAAN|nr:hypothetical protein VIGAN_09229100 [Vigna angularis var. angularis]